MTQLRRHLAAVWFADIVGYTTLSERNEGGWVTLAWAEADDALQTRVDAARQAISRLEGLRRG